MFDVSSYANGFGVVFVPFVIAVIIRSIISAINAGSTRKYYGFIFLFLFVFLSPNYSQAAVTQGPVQQINQLLIFNVNNIIFDCSTDDQLKEFVFLSYETGKEIYLQYYGSTIVQYRLIESSGYDAKNYSMFLGGLGCFAFALGMTMKI